MARGRARWTLRRRLVIGIVALLAAVSIAIGVVSVLALRSSLVAGLDDEVSSASNRFQGVAERPREAPGGGGGPRAGDILPFAGMP
ncbi:MAG: sensor histidine kinase, partial [Microbacteriaceae bacterium]|nr:sensor histidine kinase [Microbacteriaceae bacterium]